MNILANSNASALVFFHNLWIVFVHDEQISFTQTFVFLSVNIQENMEDDLVKQALLKVGETQSQSSFHHDFVVIYFKKTQHLTRNFITNFFMFSWQFHVVTSHQTNCKSHTISIFSFRC